MDIDPEGESIRNLAETIWERGMIQPLTVVRIGVSQGYLFSSRRRQPVQTWPLGWNAGNSIVRFGEDGMLSMTFSAFYEVVKVDTLVKSRKSVTPAKAGVQNMRISVDSRFRGNDNKRPVSTCYEVVKVDGALKSGLSPSVQNKS